MISLVGLQHESRRAERRIAINPLGDSIGMPALVLVLVLWAMPAASGNGIYKYTDAQGGVHFSDKPHDGRYQAMPYKPRELALSRPPRPSVPVHHHFDDLILRTSSHYEVDPALVKAVVAAESNFELTAVSKVGAQGLMQLMPATAREMGVQAPFKASENLRGGVKYLREMLNRYGDVDRALAAYNAGPEAVDHYGGIPPYPETEAYVKRVLNYYRGYQGQFPH
jgi:soluble lytic murein transglycosylase-like protein